MISITSSIYVITNKENDKQYVGQSIDVEARFRQHIKDSRHYKLKSRYLYASFNKYGIDNFDLNIIEENISKEDIGDREIYWIAKLGTFAPDGYNLTRGGGGSWGRVCTEETRAKISKAVRARMPEIGRNISKAKKGIPMLEETKAKISETLKGMTEHNKQAERELKKWELNATEEELRAVRKKRVATRHTNGSYIPPQLRDSVSKEDTMRMYEKISKNNPRSTRVFAINDEVCKEFWSIGKASKWVHTELGYGKNAKSNIRAVIDVDNRTAYGFRWRTQIEGQTTIETTLKEDKGVE